MGRALRQFLSALYNRRNSRQQPPIPPPFQRAGRLCISRRAAFFLPAFRAHPPASSRNAYASAAHRASRTFVSPVRTVSPAQHRISQSCVFPVPQHFAPILPHHPETRMFQPPVPPPASCAAHPAILSAGRAALHIPPRRVFPPGISRPSSSIIPKRVCFNRTPRRAPPVRALSLTQPPIPPPFQRAGWLCISRRAAFFLPAFRAHPPAASETRMLQPSPAPRAAHARCVSHIAAHPAPDAAMPICRTPSLFLHSKRSRRLHARVQNE